MHKKQKKQKLPRKCIIMVKRQEYFLDRGFLLNRKRNISDDFIILAQGCCDRWPTGPKLFFKIWRLKKPPGRKFKYKKNLEKIRKSENFLFLAFYFTEFAYLRLKSLIKCLRLNLAKISVLPLCQNHEKNQKKSHDLCQPKISRFLRRVQSVSTVLF